MCRCVVPDTSLRRGEHPLGTTLAGILVSDQATTAVVTAKHCVEKRSGWTWAVVGQPLYTVDMPTFHLTEDVAFLNVTHLRMPGVQIAEDDVELEGDHNIFLWSSAPTLTWLSSCFFRRLTCEALGCTASTVPRPPRQRE